MSKQLSDLNNKYTVDLLIAEKRNNAAEERLDQLRSELEKARNTIENNDFQILKYTSEERGSQNNQTFINRE